MPSPFPGMDPYLEDPPRWPDFHHRLISAISDALVLQLRPNYYARIEERVYLSGEDDPGWSIMLPTFRSGYRWEQEIHEARLNVIYRESREITTVLEVLSPGNKVSGARSRENYRLKRDEVMHTRKNLVEIDLLREGLPMMAQELLPPHDYMVLVSRAGRPERADVWPIELAQRTHHPDPSAQGRSRCTARCAGSHQSDLRSGWL